jgi:hypothetical protein
MVQLLPGKHLEDDEERDRFTGGELLVSIERKQRGLLGNSNPDPISHESSRVLEPEIGIIDVERTAGDRALDRDRHRDILVAAIRLVIIVILPAAHNIIREG